VDPRFREGTIHEPAALVMEPLAPVTAYPLQLELVTWLPCRSRMMTPRWALNAKGYNIYVTLNGTILTVTNSWLPNALHATPGPSSGWLPPCGGSARRNAQLGHHARHINVVRRSCDFAAVGFNDQNGTNGDGFAGRRLPHQ